MAGPNFYLKKPDQSGNSLIYLKWKYRGHVLVFSTGESIPKSIWHDKKQRVKDVGRATEKGDHLLNDLLDRLQEVAELKYKEHLKDGIPEPHVLKRHLSAVLKGGGDGAKNEASLYKLIEQFIAGEITDQGTDRSPATLKKYHTVYNHLKAFEKAKAYRVDFDTIDLDFFHAYVRYLKGKRTVIDRQGKMKPAAPLKANSVAKDIDTLKVFMNEAVRRKRTDNLAFRDRAFNVKEEATDAVYLKEAEILKLYRYDLSANKRLEQVRDLFVFGCYVGLRFSDFSNVKPSNIVEQDGELFLKIKTQKGGRLVVIPCHPVVLEIFEKYKNNPNRLPKAISNQKTNEYLKQAAEAAGLIETGRLSSEPETPLFAALSSHTARRSFCTNLYLQGFPAIDIMKISGHSTEAAFLRYIRHTKIESAKRLSEHQKQEWSRKILKVAI